MIFKTPGKVYRTPRSGAFGLATTVSFILMWCIAADVIAEDAIAIQPQHPQGVPVPIPHPEPVPDSAAEDGILLDLPCCRPTDRLWRISTRRLTSSARCANLESPAFSIHRIQCKGKQRRRSSLEEYEREIGSDDRPAIIYVHGNRINTGDAVPRSTSVYRVTKRYRKEGPIDWVIFSWPAEKHWPLIIDAREKARRTDAQGLYLAWLLRRHFELAVPTGLVGYSFGGRVIPNALHALAGGRLGGRTLPGEKVRGFNVKAGLLAPAVDTRSLSNNGYNKLATKNLDRLVLLYNRRDAVLKRYWLIDRVRGRMALGYSGPRRFANRNDGTSLPVRARDCSGSLGLQHDELDYYYGPCRAGVDIAALVDGTAIDGFKVISRD